MNTSEIELTFIESTTISTNKTNRYFIDKIFKGLLKISNSITQKSDFKNKNTDIFNFARIVWKHCMFKLQNVGKDRQDDFFTNYVYISHSDWKYRDIDSCIQKIKHNFVTVKHLQSLKTRNLIYFDNQGCICLLLVLDFDEHGNFKLNKKNSFGFYLQQSNSKQLKIESSKINNFINAFCDQFIDKYK